MGGDVVARLEGNEADDDELDVAAAGLFCPQIDRTAASAQARTMFRPTEERSCQTKGIAGSLRRRSVSLPVSVWPAARTDSIV